MKRLIIGGIAALALAALAIVAGVAGTKILNGGSAPMPPASTTSVTHVALTTEQIRQQVQGAIEQRFTEDSHVAPYKLRVLKLVLIRESESSNKYDGMVTLRAGEATEREIPVDVTADNASVMWNIKGEALNAYLLVAMQEDSTIGTQAGGQ
jgi:hypothetical protein